MDSYRLTGKRALVLGGTRGIGLGVAQCLADRGCVVTVAGRDRSRAAEIARELPGEHAHRALGCDLGDPAAAGEQVAAAGPFEIVLLNTPGGPPAPVEELSAGQLGACLEMMLLSIKSVVEALLPAMRSNGWGRLIGITSSSVAVPIAELAGSSIARSAVQSYLKLLAASVGRYGITVNHIVPGKIDTDRLRAVEAAGAERRGVDAASIRAATLAKIPLGRYGTPRDVGELAAFLASDLAGYLTGAAIRCDGGYLEAF